MREKEEMFGSKSLRCLVCKAIVDEFQQAIDDVDPNKKIEAGSFKMTSTGERKRDIVNIMQWTPLNRTTSLL